MLSCMSNYPNVTQAQIANLQLELPKWGFTVTPRGVGLFMISGYGVAVDANFDGQTLAISNIKRSWLGHLISDEEIDAKIKAALAAA